MSDNHVIIRLKIDTLSGVLGRAAALLMQMGLTYSKHNLNEEKDEDGQQLCLLSEGDTVDREKLSSELLAIPGILTVVDIEVTPKSRTGKVSSSGVALSAEEAQLVDTVIKSWPAIVEPLQTYEDSFKKTKEREKQVMGIGEHVGEQMAARFPELQTLDSIPAVLAQIAAPTLEKVANCTIDGDALKTNVSVFTRRYSNTMDYAYGQDHDKCYFLTGFLQGLFNKAQALPKMKVKERFCRALGDDHCVFEVKKA